MSELAGPDGADRSPSVVVVGSINVDVVARVERHPAPGETVLGAGGEMFCGGKGANQAVAAAYAGACVALVGAVGRDANAAVAALGLERAGVDLRAVVHCAGPTGLALVAVAADGENTVIVVPGANAHVRPEHLAEDRALLTGARVVVTQGELPVATTDAVATAVAEIAAGGAPARFVLNLAPVVAVAPATVLLADPLIVNEHEALGALAIVDPAAAAAFAANGSDEAREANGAGGAGEAGGARGADETGEAGDRDAIATRLGIALTRSGVRSVVVTIGSAGAVVVGPSGVTRLSAPRTDAVDTTGAGDAFVGACTAALAAGSPLVDAARTAVAFAARSVQRPGAQASYAHAAGRE